MLLRVTVVVLVLAAGAVLVLVARTGNEPVKAVKMPDVRPAPALWQTAREGPGGDEGSGSSPGGRTCSREAVEESERGRIGSFERPEDVPEYEILEDEPVERDGAKAARLLVNTRASSEAEYTPIARDIKARYRDYDAITVEFTDVMGTLSYNGSALIFNTPCGAYYIGYAYGPPNNEGYVVSASSR